MNNVGMKPSASVTSPEPLEILSREESEAIAKGIIDRMTAPSGAVSVECNASSATQFSRNDVRYVGGTTRLTISVVVDWYGTRVTGYTTKRDPKGLDEVVSHLEGMAKSIAQLGK